MAEPVYRRIVLKVSGEALAGDHGFGISPLVIRAIADEVREVHALGVEIGIVIGGGNVIRGVSAASEGMDRASADYMGMLASIINGLALQDALERHGQQTRVLSGIAMSEVCEPYIRRRAIRHLEKGRVVIFAAGMGNPFFTTDTPAALRAAEIEAGVVLKGTHSGVNGVYVGPSDLSLSMGKPPTLDPTDKEVLTAIDIIVKTTRKWGHIAGVHTDGPATALRRYEAGFQMCTILNDVRLLAVAAQQAVNEVRGKGPAAKAKTY